MSQTPRTPLLLYVGGALVLGAAAAGVFILAHARSSQAREELGERTSLQAAGPKVLVDVAKRTSPEREVRVQAEVRPYAEVTLYSKVAGYLRELPVDKGDQVKRGALLARIEVPELDAQLVAAKADAKYKQVNAKRAEALVEPGVVSAQDRDVAVSSAEVAAATQQSYEVQKGYEVLRAPFDGTITARFCDPGALLQNAGGAQSSALPIVTLSQLDTLRIYGYVDQRDAAFIKVGDAAEIVLAERPGQPLRAKVTRLAGELDPRTRMMLVELDVDNHARQIVPGSFVDLVLHLPVPSYVEVPASALVMRGSNPFVPVIDAQDKINFHAVEIVSDDGQNLRLLKGVEEGERVALNLGDGVADGSKIQPVTLASPGGPDVAKPK